MHPEKPRCHLWGLPTPVSLSGTAGTFPNESAGAAQLSPARDGPRCLAAHLEFSQFGNKDLLTSSCQLNVSPTSLAKDPRLCSVPVSKMDLVVLTWAGKRHTGVAALLGTRGVCGELCP